MCTTGEAGGYTQATIGAVDLSGRGQGAAGAGKGGVLGEGQVRGRASMERMEDGVLGSVSRSTSGGSNGAAGPVSGVRVEVKSQKRGAKLKQQVCDKVVRELLKSDKEGTTPLLCVRDAWLKRIDPRHGGECRASVSVRVLRYISQHSPDQFPRRPRRTAGALNAHGVVLTGRGRERSG